MRVDPVNHRHPSISDPRPKKLVKTPVHAPLQAVNRARMLAALPKGALQGSANGIGDASKATAGYRAAMYGEVGAGLRKVNLAPQMRLGGIVQKSSVADRAFVTRTPGRGNFGIDEFSRPDFRGVMARNPMVSSQATRNHGRNLVGKEGVSPSEVRFESRRADGRFMDVTRPGQHRGTVQDTKIKAGERSSPARFAWTSRWPARHGGWNTSRPTTP